MKSTNDDEWIGCHLVKLVGSTQEKMQVFGLGKIVKVFFPDICTGFFLISLVPLKAIPE
jgi:hypothetical protein